MVNILIILMSLISLYVFRFFHMAKAVGDEEMFYVIGRWIPGIAGLFIAVLGSVGTKVVGASMLLPGVLFMFCLLWTYINMSPILRVDGANVKIVTLGGSVTLNRNEINHDEEANGVLIHIYDKALEVRKDSINFGRFMSWLEK